MKPAPNPTLTPARIRALEFLEKNPGHFVVGCGTARCHVMRLGWSDWAKNDRGEIIGEQLTDLGRATLAAHRLAQIPKPEKPFCPLDCFLGRKLPTDCPATNVASMQRSGIEDTHHA